ncbi:hypothetical protein J4209_06240 [Candidatus Woesearchaeota archaeon]|nr:hypothetical protein [Candidatus Woesearchaeota archaeon]
MRESLDNSNDELKRVDHLIFVSLKYTRTVDVIRNTIDRMINALDFSMEALLKYAKEKKKIDSYPNIPGQKAAILERVYSNEAEIVDAVRFYLNLRKVIRARYTKREEYRRHVTMIATTESEEVEIDIDRLREYYEKTKNFFKFCENLIEGVKE